MYNTSWAWKICKCSSFCVVSYMWICFPSVLCFFFVPLLFVVFVCVISILPCLWILSFFLINPLPCSFGIHTMEQWRQYLCRFHYTYDFMWRPPPPPPPPLILNNADSYKLSYVFLFFQTIDLKCTITFLLSLLERGWFCYCVISYD